MSSQDPISPAPTGTSSRPPGGVIPLVEAEVGSRALNEALRSSLRVVKFLMILIVGVVVFSGVFTVEPNEVALVLRFGRPVGSGPTALLRPGLHWSFPYPIDEIVRLPSGQSHSVTSSIGWYAVSPEQLARGEEPEPKGTLIPGVDGYLLGGDGTIFHARATLKFRIQDPVRYAFTFRQTTNLLQLVLNNSLLVAAAGVTAESAIYRDKLSFRDAVSAELAAAVESHRLGIALDPVEVQVVAPVDVRGAFEAVLAAEQERSQRMNEARGFASESILKAGGEAQAIMSAGESARQQLVLSVGAEARYFNDQLAYFQQDPVLFRRRLLAETMEQILSRASDVFLLPSATPGDPHQVRLQLNREPQRSKPTEQPTR